MLPSQLQTAQGGHMNGLTSLRSLTGGFMMQGEKADSAEIEED